MSGGHLDYAYYNIESIAVMVESSATTALHRAFAAHLRLVARAAHDLEWVWSGDYKPGDEVAALQAVCPPAFVLDQAVSDARKALQDLTEVLKAASQGNA